MGQTGALIENNQSTFLSVLCGSCNKPTATSVVTRQCVQGRKQFRKMIDADLHVLHSDQK